MSTAPAWLDAVKFDAAGLVPTIAQDAATGEILMVAWMDRDALLKTVETGIAHYYSRSRGRPWMKGEESGHTQRVQSVSLDCDGDVVRVSIEQVGGIACHTGRRSCFFRTLRDGEWVETLPVLKDPSAIYR
ncbi:MAG: phosphoribosyl-AMP cyclohydrolase [Burkholderiales bacterium]